VQNINDIRIALILCCFTGLL